MTYNIKEDSSLQHYGVKGMKWGVRKARPSSSSSSSSSRVSPKVRRIARTAGKIGAGTGLAAIGIPLAVNAAIVATTDAQLVSYGQAATKSYLHDFGLVKMSSIEEAKVLADIDPHTETFLRRLPG